MLKSYFLLAWRNLLKHRSSAIINISRLALGLTTSLLVLLFLVDELSYDHFHQNVANLYLLMKNQKEADGVSTGRNSAGPMAGALRAELPDVVNSTREAGSWTQGRVGDKQVEIHGIYVDTGFFSMMSFPAVAGDPAAALRDRSAVVVTESMAKKLFGDDPAMGKVFVINDTV